MFLSRCARPFVLDDPRIDDPRCYAHEGLRIHRPRPSSPDAPLHVLRHTLGCELLGVLHPPLHAATRILPLFGTYGVLSKLRFRGYGYPYRRTFPAYPRHFHSVTNTKFTVIYGMECRFDYA
jgi:hypothetical protein